MRKIASELADESIAAGLAITKDLMNARQKKLHERTQNPGGSSLPLASAVLKAKVTPLPCVSLTPITFVVSHQVSELVESAVSDERRRADARVHEV